MTPFVSPIPSEPTRPRSSFLRRWKLPNPQVALCANHDHFAILYDNPAEQLDFIVPFLRLGLERGEKSIFIYDDNNHQTVIAAMERHGIDVAAACAAGALCILTKKQSYLKNGDFDPDWMIDFFAQTVQAAKKEGFSAVRASGEMTWALGPTGNAHDRLIEYECKLNTFFPTHDIGCICQYNRRRFQAQTLMHVIHSHSKVVFRGEMCDNPYYIPAKILSSQSDEPVRRLLESMAENTRLRRQLAAESEMARRSEKLAVAARMAASLAHEINNSLEAMTNSLYLLEQENLPANAASYVRILSEELERVRQTSKRTIEAVGVAQANGESGAAKAA